MGFPVHGFSCAWVYLFRAQNLPNNLNAVMGVSVHLKEFKKYALGFPVFVIMICYFEVSLFCSRYHNEGFLSMEFFVH